MTTATELERRANSLFAEADCRADTAQGYAEWVVSHPRFCGDKLRKFWGGIMLPIMQGESSDYFFDPKPGEDFRLFCQGVIPNRATYEAWLSRMPAQTRGEKVKQLRFALGDDLGHIQQVEGPETGEPLILMPWQFAFISALLGTKRKSDGLRRFSEAFLVVARKNGKTTLEEPLAINEILTEKGARVYCVATSFNQSRALFENAAQMVAKSPDLDTLLTWRKFPGFEMFFRDRMVNNSKFAPLAFNPEKQDGFNPSVAIIDEVHELDKREYEILKQGQGAWKEPLLVMITTAGFVRGELFDQKYRQAVDLLNGRIQADAFMPVVYEINDGDSIEDPAVWFKANPSAGVSKSFKYLSEQVASADQDPTARPGVMTKDFNVIGVSSSSWLSYATVNNPRVLSSEELKELDNTECIGGFDLGATSDLTAWNTLLFDRRRGLAVCLTKYWCTQDFLKSKENDKGQPWEAWIRSGLVEIGGEHMIDYTLVADHVQRLVDEHGYRFYAIGYDPWQAPYLINELKGMGFSDGPHGVLQKVRQGFRSLSVPMTTLKAMLESKRLIYQNNQVTKWMLLNVELEEDRNGNLMPAKRDSNRRNKIDGVSAILDCLYPYVADPEFYGGPDLARCIPVKEEKRL